MQARDPHASRTATRLLVALGAFALLFCATTGTGLAKKKHKKKPPLATTVSSIVPFAGGGTANGTANCPKKTHVVGGGFLVSPNFVPPGSGTRSVTGTSNPVGTTTWTATSTAYTAPATSGTLTGFARCEQNSIVQQLSVPSSSGSLGLGQKADVILNCAPGSHVVGGGYSTPGIPVPSDPNKSGPIVLQSRRTALGQWTVTAVNPSAPVGVAGSTVAGFAICEKSKRTISEVSSANTAIPNDGRLALDPACPSKQHVVSGGFVASPLSGTTAPAISVDESQPVGSSVWHTGLYEYPGYALPAGSSITSSVYCASNKPPKKPKPRKIHIVVH